MAVEVKKARSYLLGPTKVTLLTALRMNARKGFSWLCSAHVQEHWMQPVKPCLMERRIVEAELRAEAVGR